MIPIKTPKGDFRVWTKRVGNNPRIKVLLLHGGPGATHEYFEAADSYFPALCGTGDTNTRKRECAAYFASKDQETGMGQYDRELYCQPGGGGYGGAACNY